MIDERDDSVKSAGTHQGHTHATDAGADARPHEQHDQRTMNDAPDTAESPAGDQPPSRIAGVEEEGSSPAGDIPNLGDEGGGSRYGDDDADGDREESEYSGQM